MLQNLIKHKKNEWLASKDCTVLPIIQYIKEKGELRDAQIEAIETYLFLKIKGQNRPLWQLFSEGFFNLNEDLSALPISQYAREFLEKNISAHALFEFSRQKKGSSLVLPPELEKLIIKDTDKLDYTTIIKTLFYGVDYSDYLFSLPMGAGKTFLMAAFIYLDLYFALNEPANRMFAHNFIILVPSGLKSSIIPSLKTIEKFDPSWVLPEPSASNIKRLIKFELLDQPKSAKKSNKARNPNAQKINQHQPFDELMGLVMVVNAEKVILDRIDIIKNGGVLKFDFHETDDERDKQANELRNLIGKIPNLSIYIDEVHHAATDDIKLRQVVNRWNANGTINSVIGYSGTPYLSSPDKIIVNNAASLSFKQMTNTVFYYPLTRAIQTFLKKPRVEVASGLIPLKIIKKGVKDFYDNFKNTVYDSGACAKLAIYCGNIARLEREVYPFLVGSMQIPPEDILKYHKGNKEFKLAKENETEFNSLDTLVSKKRIVLLVQVGKEGWDCRSLTGVILAQKGDSPTNMVLQTSCRCLRQVDKGKHESAVIWLNDYNAKTLNSQLKDEQHTSIADINRLGRLAQADMIDRFPRLEHLKLPPIDFYQLKVEYKTLVVEETPNTTGKLSMTLKDKSLYNAAVITSRGLNLSDPQIKSFIEKEGSVEADFQRWVFDISKGSFNAIAVADLMTFETELRKIFNAVTFKENGAVYFNELYNHLSIKSRIRLAFHCKRELQTKDEVIPATARMLLVEKLAAVEKNDNLYPNENDTKQILDFDKTGKSIMALQQEIEETQRQIKELLEKQGKVDLLSMMGLTNQTSYSQAVLSKELSFHYLPYNFWQSKFELNILKGALTLKEITDRQLEIYYNGEKDITDFRILCYARLNSHWKYTGKYTPDFLMIQRRDNGIHKALIIETKGGGFADQKTFLQKRHFIETEFLKTNNEKFGYQKFDYLYLEDTDNMDQNLANLNAAIVNFFE